MRSVGVNPGQSPNAFSAGTSPPELAGRDRLIDRFAVAPDRNCAGNSTRSFILYGLRGVGETFVLNLVLPDAATGSIASVPVEAPGKPFLSALLISTLRAKLLCLNCCEAKNEDLLTGMRTPASHTKVICAKSKEIDLTASLGPRESSAYNSTCIGAEARRNPKFRHPEPDQFS